MSKKKYSDEFKKQVALHYINTSDGMRKTANRFGIDHGTVRKWTEHWKASGENGFKIKIKHHSAEFKESVILWMQDNNQSSRKAAAKFMIASACTVSRWVRLYREGGILALHNKRHGDKLKPIKNDLNSKKTKLPEFKSLEEELEYLRTENAYLKKLQALIQKKQNIKHK